MNTSFALRSILGALALTLVAAGSLTAQDSSNAKPFVDLSASGYIKAAGLWAWNPSPTAKAFPFAGIIGNLRLEADMGEFGAVVAATEASLDLGHILDAGTGSCTAKQYYPLGFRYDIDGRIAAELDIKELYYENTFGDFGLRLGKQIIVWGQADGSNPTDIINARHVGTRSGASTDENRMGALALDLAWYLPDGKSKIEAVGLPYSIVNDMPLPVMRTRVFTSPNAFAPNIDVELEAAEKPEFTLKNIEGALRGLFYLGDWSFSLSYFNILDRYPDIRAGSYTELGIPSVTPDTIVNTQTPVYNRIHAVGGDMVTTIQGFDFRVEGLLSLTSDTTGDDLYTKNSNLSAVVQLSHSWFNGAFSTALSWAPRYVFDWQDYDTYGATFKNAALQTYAQNGQGFEFEQGIGFRGELKALNETLTLTGFGLYNVMARDYLAQASAGYNLADGLNLKVGATLYGGFRASDDPRKAFGVFGNATTDRKDNLFAELVWSF